MNPALPRSIVNPGIRTPVTGLKAAVTTDSAIITKTMMQVPKQGGDAVEVA